MENKRWFCIAGLGVSERRPHVHDLACSFCLHLPEIPILAYTVSNSHALQTFKSRGSRAFQHLQEARIWVPRSAFSLRLTPGLWCTGCNSWKAAWFHGSCLWGWEMRKGRRGKWDKTLCRLHVVRTRHWNIKMRWLIMQLSISQKRYKMDLPWAEYCIPANSEPKS